VGSGLGLQQLRGTHDQQHAPAQLLGPPVTLQLAQGKADEAHHLKAHMWDSYVSASKQASTTRSFSLALDDSPPQPPASASASAAVPLPRVCTSEFNARARRSAVSITSIQEDTPKDWAAMVAKPAAAASTPEHSASYSTLLDSTRECTWSLLSQTVTGEVSAQLKRRPLAAASPLAASASGDPGPADAAAAAEIDPSGEQQMIKDDAASILAAMSERASFSDVRLSDASRFLAVPSFRAPTEAEEGEADTADVSVYIPTLGLQCASSRTSASSTRPSAEFTRAA